MTYGYCVYHELECDYDGQCKECPHNSNEDTKWFENDEARMESKIEKSIPFLKENL